MEEKLCFVCHANESKYRCPACGVRTCSNICVNRHKKQTECTGVVDQTKFISKKKLLKDQTYSNRDYNFLLNIGRKLEVKREEIQGEAKNVFKRSYNGPDSKSKRIRTNSNDEDKRLAKVYKVYPRESRVLTKRNNTLTVYQPPGMTRANRNKTGYDKKSASFIWTVEWVIIGREGQELHRFVSYRIKEHLRLREALPVNIIRNNAPQFPPEVDSNDISFYLVNIIERRKNHPNLIPLDPDMSLSSALQDKIVLEYPTIHATLKDCDLGDQVIKSADVYELEGTTSADDTSSDGDSSSDNDSDSSDDSSTSSSDSQTSDSSDNDSESSGDEKEPSEDN
ncbi:Piso0_000541 [Millerozyma farinosa CBS 7064]|uniref:Piso0_000541 protein n=1 Tax=Pichia sorbitophila (strain ATCC MYA-4447 / BCRC 22081 / CBS 7064 / NBRC 10061 / NRRL Y-12695) TaxID=559304 RepID=G8YVQ2_PICSO|nr:Piso0_000541 [Millerozyma farinosa CBS 7064]CCE73496.1 Piso0_000541 [Millerozyma farinosa CBS 7064]